MWLWLETTPVALWVGESLWAYPVILSLHGIGLAVVVGVFAVRDMRLLGLFPGIDPRVFLDLGKLGWAGFIVNAISGVLLFVSQAYTFVHSVPFLLKISFILLAMIMAAVIQSRLRSSVTDIKGAVVVPAATRAIAFISLMLWLGALIAGRLIAYL